MNGIIHIHCELSHNTGRVNTNQVLMYFHDSQPSIHIVVQFVTYVQTNEYQFIKGHYTFVLRFDILLSPLYEWEEAGNRDPEA